MALNISTDPLFTGRVTGPNAAYPYGSSKDETAPGNNDGTPYLKKRADDVLGFMQSLLAAGGVIPNGLPDSVTNAQYLGGLYNFMNGRFNLGFNYKDRLAVSNWPGDPLYAIEVGSGAILDSTGSLRMYLPAPEVRQIHVNWVEAGPGGFSNASTLLATANYGVYIIAKADGTAHIIIASSAADALADTNVAAAGYIYVRRIYRVTRIATFIFPWYKIVNNRTYYTDELILTVSQTHNAGAVLNATFLALGFHLSGTYQYRITLNSNTGTAVARVSTSSPTSPAISEGDAVARLDEYNSNTVELSSLFYVRINTTAGGVLTTNQTLYIALRSFDDDITIL